MTYSGIVKLTKCNDANKFETKQENDNKHTNLLFILLIF